jgi:hypothetical protein
MIRTDAHVLGDGIRSDPPQQGWQKRAIERFAAHLVDGVARA